LEKSKKLEDFLIRLDLTKYLPVFKQEYVDYEELGYLNDLDLKELGIPLGHRRKILRERGVWNNYILYNPALQSFNTQLAPGIQTYIGILLIH
jgi:hypothetical protein